MSDILLTLNAGSSSLKFAAFRVGPEPTPVLRGQVESLEHSPVFSVRGPSGELREEKRWPVGAKLDHGEALQFLFARLGDLAEGARPVGVGHRVVHGGTEFAAPVCISETVSERLGILTELAPLHQQHNLAAIREVARQAPGLPQVACFDTAFHRTQPPLAQLYALPRRYTDAGIVRYGFHGLSYEYVAGVLRRLDTAAFTGRTVVAHLGNGASMCALNQGHSVATTMGFTPLDGLPMGTRCGSIDPGALLFLMDREGADARSLEELLYHQSGLLGVSGVSGDVRTLLASPDPRAAEAIDLFVYRIGRELGSLAAALGGLDALVFTAGIGENSAEIRARVCRDAAWLGLEIDDAANTAGNSRISRSSSRVRAWLIPTDEELMIARHTWRVLGIIPAATKGGRK